MPAHIPTATHLCAHPVHTSTLSLITCRWSMVFVQRSCYIPRRGIICKNNYVRARKHATRPPATYIIWFVHLKVKEKESCYFRVYLKTIYIFGNKHKCNLNHFKNYSDYYDMLKMFFQSAKVKVTPQRPLFLSPFLDSLIWITDISQNHSLSGQDTAKVHSVLGSFDGE